MIRKINNFSSKRNRLRKSKSLNLENNSVTIRMGEIKGLKNTIEDYKRKSL